MKNLYLLRHAKSSWKETNLRDFDRPLNKRGKRDAPFIGGLLAQYKDIPDLIVSSPAKRAIATAEKIAEKINYPVAKIITNKRLYEADIDDFMNVLFEVPEEVETLMIVSHNPGLTLLSNYISDKRIDNIPTTGVVQIELNVKRWKDVDFDNGKILSFDYPKKYQEELNNL